MAFLDFCPGWLTKIQLCLLTHGKQKHEHPFAVKSHKESQETAGVAWGSGTTQHSHLQQPVHKITHHVCPDQATFLHDNPRRFPPPPSPPAFETRHFRFNKGSYCNGLRVWKPEQVGETELTTFPRKAVKAHSPTTLPGESTEQTQLWRKSRMWLGH